MDEKIAPLDADTAEFREKGRRGGLAKRGYRVHPLKLEMRELATRYGPEVLETLLEIMRDERNASSNVNKPTHIPERSRIARIKSILEIPGWQPSPWLSLMTRNKARARRHPAAPARFISALGLRVIHYKRLRCVP